MQKIGISLWLFCGHNAQWRSKSLKKKPKYHSYSSANLVIMMKSFAMQAFNSISKFTFNSEHRFFFSHHDLSFIGKNPFCSYEEVKLENLRTIRERSRDSTE